MAAPFVTGVLFDTPNLNCVSIVWLLYQGKTYASVNEPNGSPIISVMLLYTPFAIQANRWVVMILTQSMSQ